MSSFTNYVKSRNCRSVTIGVAVIWSLLVIYIFTRALDGNVKLHGIRNISASAIGDLMFKKKNPPRIFCITATCPQRHNTRGKSVVETWGKRCDYLYFITTMDGKKYPFMNLIYADVPDGWKYSWGKQKASFRYIYENYIDKIDWILRLDDDTYVIMENLRAFLEDKDSSEPVVYGQQTSTHHLIRNDVQYDDWGFENYNDGGAGYAISRKAMELVVEKGIGHPDICPDGNFVEDAVLGECWKNLGVRIGNPIDMTGEKFHRDSPSMALSLGPKDKRYGVSKYPTGTGMNCCSVLTITFHHLKVEEMYALEMLIYKIKVVGLHEIDNLEKLLSEGSVLDLPLANKSTVTLRKQIRRRVHNLSL